MDDVNKYEHILRQNEILTRENNFLKNELANTKKDLQKGKDTDKIRKLLMLINEYSLDLANIKSDEIFSFALQKIKNFLDAKSVHYTTYDKGTKELVLKETSLSPRNLKIIKNIVGKDLIGMRFKTDEKKYQQILTEKIATVHSIHELSFGIIPDFAGRALEKIFNVGWFIGIALIQNNELLGTFVIIGEQNTTVPDNEVLLAFAGITSNALERKKAEENLKDSEQKLKTYLESSPDGIFITNYDGIVLDVNDSGARLTGYSKNELVGKNVNLIVHTNHMLRIDKQIDSLISNGQNFRTKIQYIDKPGKIRNALVSTVRINQDLYAAFVKNIDDIIEAENNLIKEKEKAEESDRLKSAFLSNMSHEIRSPMNGILGFTSLLKKENLSHVKRKEFIGIIEKCGNQLLLLIDDILDIAKIEANQIKIELKTCNIHNIFNEIYLQYKAKTDAKKIDFIFEYPANRDSLYLITDCFRFKQIIVNLVTNAIKFTSNGYIKVGYNIIGDFIEIYVEDTGTGIESKSHEMIFGRFKQADNQINGFSTGTGLGLAITKGLVNLLGGEIFLDSTQGQGSKFYFKLPYTPVHGNNTENSEFSEEFETTKATEKRILICEDDNDNFAYLDEIVKSFGYNSLRAENGNKAIEIVSEDNDLLFVLMDIKMPVMNGYDATINIKKLKPSLPVIAQTAYAGATEKQKYMQCGFDEYLTKPILIEDIYRLIKKHEK